LILTRFCLFLAFCLATSISFSGDLKAQAVVNLSIIVYSNELEPGEKVYLQSDNARFAFYGPTGIPLVKTGPGTHMVSMKAKIGDQISFSITRGNYSKVARDQAGTEIPLQTVIVERNILLEYRVSGWADRKGYVAPPPSSNSFENEEPIAPDAPFVRMRKHTNLKPDGNLLSRDIKVLLPDGYNEGSKRYPVLYVHDGFQVLADEAVHSKDKWRIDDMLDQMTDGFELEPHILVVINNSGSRTLEGSTHAIAKLYARFVATQLKGFIDNKYRTQTDAGSHTYLGANMGGLVAFMLAWEFDQYVSNAICLSPTFEFPRIYYSYVGEATEKLKAPNGQKIYIDVGKEGIDDGNFPGADKMATLLRQEGYDASWYTGSVNCEYDSWDDRLKRALRYALD